MKRHIVRTARLSIGLLLIALGVVSGFIPILQGWVFILAGLTVMAPESHSARRVLDWVKAHLHRRKRASSKQGAAETRAPADSNGRSV